MSTINSISEAVQGAGQQIYASITGNPSDAQKAQESKDKAQLEHDAAHTTAKVGPISVNPAGGVAQDSPDRTQGSYNQAMGSGKQAIGETFGIQSLASSGKQQHEDGQAQELQGQASDLKDGAAQRVTATAQGIGAAITGNKEKQEKAQLDRDDARAKYNGVLEDVNKKAEAEANARSQS